MPDTIFYIDRRLNPRQNPLLNSSNPTTDNDKLTFVAGDKISVALVFLNGTDIDTTMATGSIPKYINLSIGQVGLDSPSVSTTNWYLSSSYGYTSSLNLSPLTASVGTEEYVDRTMQLSVSSSDGTKQTAMITTVRIYNPVDII